MAVKMEKKWHQAKTGKTAKWNYYMALINDDSTSVSQCAVSCHFFVCMYGFDQSKTKSNSFNESWMPKKPVHVFENQE